jgi:ERCC4-related helicase
LELLLQYGVKSFYNFLRAYTDNSDKSKSAQQAAKLRGDIAACEDMNEFYELFRRSFEQEGSTIPTSLRHPKLIKLEELILEHFEQFAKTASEFISPKNACKFLTFDYST